MQNIIIAVDKQHLSDLIKQEMYTSGNQCDLNHIDVSLIKDMSNLFQNSDFNGDISGWDVSQVENMDFMFYQSKFNGNILNWKPYNLTLFEMILHNCPAPIPYWTTYNNKDERKKAIDSYHLHKQLNNELSDTSNQRKKPKI